MQLSNGIHVLVFVLFVAVGCGSSGDGGGIDRDVEKYITIENGIYGQVTIVNDVGNNDASYMEGSKINIYMKDDELIESNIVASGTSDAFGFYEIELSDSSYKICTITNQCKNLDLGMAQIVRCNYEIGVISGWDCGTDDSGSVSSEGDVGMSCNDDNNIDQPDMTGSPNWSSSAAGVGSEVQLNVPVDEDTGYVNVVLHHTQNVGGSWIATGGFGALTIMPGQAQSVSVPVQITSIGSTPQSGNYFPTITLCRSKEECISGTDMNISYAGSGTVTAGETYTRVHNEGFENIHNAASCYIIPVLTVTE